VTEQLARLTAPALADRPALALARFSAGLRNLPPKETLERVEIAALETVDRRPRKDIALRGLGTTRAARG
jgi:hypothetical protein